TGQPLLVGTISIEKSEYLSRMLEKRGIQHQVLNAKHHEKEAQIIALAGQRDAVTIATNMAGRGTDIILGEGVPDLGGLHIIGTERHEARRIDNQLRGRSGRQGDPGSSQFFISLEDDLMRLFGSDNIMNMMDKLGVEEDMPIEHSLLTKAIETAQKRVEARNFDIRKHVLEYDNVMNQQREVIYKQRRDIIEGDNLKPTILTMIRTMIDTALETYCSEKVFPEEWDMEGLFNYVAEVIPLPEDFTLDKIKDLGRDDLKQEYYRVAEEAYERREQELGDQIMRELERVITLRMVDTKWMDHIDAMDELRAGIGLRAYGQKDPLVEYKFEAYDMFTAMTNSIQEDIARTILRVHVEQPPEREAVAVVNDTEGPTQPVTGPAHKVGRNDPCPCGSGKKYKHCCGK
ncbi:MAG: SEC-C metal-binding domain-containing protein, partial [Bacillota bacterium]